METLIRDIPDFPKKGVVFKDITPLLGNAAALAEVVDRLAVPFADAGVEAVVGIESRGFIFGSLVAQRLGVGFVPVRKLGKLPYKTIQASYDLEYGRDSVEMHVDAIAPGQKVLVVDDLIATGGTVGAACQLIEQLGGQIVGLAFVIELSFLKGRHRLSRYRMHSLIDVSSE
ncbi:MAG: adenine phosphoribosyltransferase [Phycisphaerae bacterium]|nr:adenine phosphoribosyltransferase [Phycisphaerae bacterium]